jgi:hypothetical protein
MACTAMSCGRATAQASERFSFATLPLVVILFPTANIYVHPDEASLERKLAEIYESPDADNDSARPH